MTDSVLPSPALGPDSVIEAAPAAAPDGMVTDWPENEPAPSVDTVPSTVTARAESLSVTVSVASGE